MVGMSGEHPTVKGRFRAGGRFDVWRGPAAALRTLLAGIWDGVRLRCPSCGQGKLYGSKGRLNTACSCCGVVFERPEEGDFVGAIVTAYAITAGVVLALVLALNAYTQVGLTVQLVIAVGVAVSLLFFGYHSMRGIWVTLLVALTKWLR